MPDELPTVLDYSRRSGGYFISTAKAMSWVAVINGEGSRKFFLYSR